MDAQKAIGLIKREGLWGLGLSDGCNCCHFEVQAIQVDISCHKSEHCIRVSSKYLYSAPEELEQVMRQVLLSFAESCSISMYYLSKYRLRFCEYRPDHVGGHWKNKVWTETYECCYCGAPREHKEAYLCPKCSSTADAIRSYPWTKDGFLRDSILTGQLAAEIRAITAKVEEV